MLLRYLLVLCGFVLGILLLQSQPVLPAASSSLIILIACLSLYILINNAKIAIPFMMAVAMASGFAWAHWRAHLRLEEKLAIAIISKPVWVNGYVASIAQSKTYGPQFIFQPDQTGMGRIQVLGCGKNGLPPAGSAWRLQLKLKPVHAQQNPGAFDMESWFLQQDIAATASCRHAERLPDRFGPAQLLLALRDAMARHISTQLAGAPYQAVIVALTVGEQGGIEPAQWQRFSATGVTHLISISGLHITLLATLIAAAVRRVWPLSPRLCGYLAAPHAALLAGVLTALVYSLLAGMSVPTQRTVLMLLVTALMLQRGRRMAISAIWLSALAAVVAFDPFAVLAIGFWLSFLTVGFLLWSGSHLLGRQAHWRAWLISQFAASIATLPLLILVFGRLPLVSPLANAFAIPLVSMLVTPLALAGLIDPSGTLLWLAERTFALTDQGLILCERLAGSPMEWATPSLATLPFALAGCLLLLMPRGLPCRCLGILLLVPLFLLPDKAPGHGQFRAIAIDVGQGSATLIRTHRHALLIDTGREGNAERAILPVLRSENVLALDEIVLSHDDADHTGAASALLPLASKIRHSLPDRHALLQQTAKPQVRCTAGQRWQWDGVEFAIWWPLANASGPDNALSCVIRVSNGHFSLLVPADIGHKEESALIDAGLPSTDVVLVPHHGSKTSSSGSFLASLRPAHAVVSAGFRNRFRHPAPAVLDRYHESGARLWRTDYDGAVIIEASQKLEISAFRNSRPRYWYTRPDNHLQGAQ